MNEGEGGELNELIVNLVTGESKPEHLSRGSYINDKRTPGSEDPLLHFATIMPEADRQAFSRLIAYTFMPF